MQTLHIATAGLLWLFMRRLGLRIWPAALGCFFFAMHMSTLPAYWKLMYVFDVLCSFWVMLSLVLYQRERVGWSLLCAWLAFKSKEMELMVPVVLLLYEWYFGRKQWKRLIPFFLVSLMFGLQGLFQPEGKVVNPYTKQLTFQAFWTGMAYYGGKLLYAPYAGLAVSLGLLFLRVRLVTFGVIGFWILLLPMFAFPGRQSGAYLYVPMLLFAVPVAAVGQWRPWLALLFWLVWIPPAMSS